MRYPVSLALVDYLPVVATLAGQCLLVIAIPHAFVQVYGIACAAIALMFTGGFLKATWKIIIAVTERDVRWMEHALFPLLAPGACLFAWALWVASSGNNPPSMVTLLIPLSISAVLVVLSSRRMGHSAKWFMPLVALLTISMGLVAWFCYRLAMQQGEQLAAGFFVLSFIVSLVTASVSRKVATIAMQWLMEISNSCSALFFLIGAWLLI